MVAENQRHYNLTDGHFPIAAGAKDRYLWCDQADSGKANANQGSNMPPGIQDKKWHQQMAQDNKNNEAGQCTRVGETYICTTLHLHYWS